MFILVFVGLSFVLLFLFGTKIVYIEQTEKLKKNSAIVTKDYQFLSKYVPEAAADYCTDLWKLYDFTLNIKGDRKTKLGDFRVDRAGKRVSISVNGTLNAYAFLVTYLHEVAHLTTWQQHGRSVKPHGREWQAQFRLLMQPLLNTEIFPAEVLQPLKAYMRAPSASTASCPALWVALRIFDEHALENICYLSQVADGDKFRFSETIYLKVEVRRTRALCQNLSNGRRYLISTVAQVELVA